MDRGAWRATVHGVAKSRTRLNDEYFIVGPLFIINKTGFPQVCVCVCFNPCFKTGGLIILGSLAIIMYILKPHPLSLYVKACYSHVVVS